MWRSGKSSRRERLRCCGGSRSAGPWRSPGLAGTLNGRSRVVGQSESVVVTHRFLFVDDSVVLEELNQDSFYLLAQVRVLDFNIRPSFD